MPVASWLNGPRKVLRTRLVFSPETPPTSDIRNYGFSFCFFPLCRYLDVYNQSYIMVMASGRWLGVHVDLLASLLIGSVAIAAVLISQDAGTYLIIH